MHGLGGFDGKLLRTELPRAPQVAQACEAVAEEMEPNLPEKIRLLLEKQAIRGAGDDLDRSAIQKLADKLQSGHYPHCKSPIA